MDVLSILSSVNKISLVAFIVVFGALIYEVTLLRKTNTRKGKPSIPQFNTNTQARAAEAKVLITETKKKNLFKSSRWGIFLILGLVILSISGIILLSRILQGSPGDNNIQPIKTKASGITPTVPSSISPTVIETVTPTPTVTQEQLTGLTLTPTVTISLTPSPTGENNTIAFNNTPTPTPQPSVTGSITPQPTVSSAPTPTIANNNSPTPTAVQTLPITGNTSFTVMAIGLSGIIVLLSFVF